MISDLHHKLLFLDGGMGTMIQKFNLSESNYRGARFDKHTHPLKGNNDVLVLTIPDVIQKIHKAYIDAGADIIETCTFNANSISQAEYGLDNFIPELNAQAVKIAKNAIQEAQKSCLIAGSVGPTNISLSMAQDADHPEVRHIDFDKLSNAYQKQIETLILNGVDLILLETIFDALNTKAALYALENARKSTGILIPVMISATLADSAGRLLNGQSMQAFVDTVLPFNPISIGLNCGFGVDEMARYIPMLAQMIPEHIAISCYPNAGLPDENGAYHDDARKMATKLAEFAQAGYLNIIGGCCGTTPNHIREIHDHICAILPNRFVSRSSQNLHNPMHLCGLESIPAQHDRLIVAERANVTGSRKFKRLIEQKNWEEALDTARSQMKYGAHLIDICMDDAMLDAKACMQNFLRRLAAEPEISKYPLVLDSSNFDVLRTGLKESIGRCLINSISLKAGEENFLAQAKEIQSLGAAVVVMAFDEQGQAANTQRRVDILTRAVNLLIQKLNFRPSDIAVDPNILAIGTGLEEHATQAISFIETCHIMREKFPGLQTIGGLSNLSFSFRGRDDVRAAIHRAFLDRAGNDLTMVIANPAALNPDSPAELKQLAEDLVANSAPDTLEKLLAWMDAHAPNGAKKAPESDASLLMTPENRLVYAFTQGISKYLEEDMKRLSETMSPLEIIEGPLMNAMNEVGNRFGKGEMYLPQIVKAARLMKQAIGHLNIEDSSIQSAHNKKKILLATVWGDVHDIGKNIVSIVLSCNGYEVIDLGVMVETDRIVKEAIAHQVDAIGLSGLISPSLNVMVDVAKALNDANVRVPLIVGGAATSDIHAALKLAPAYAPGTVCHVADASRVPGELAPWLAPETRDASIEAIEAHHRDVIQAYEQKQSPVLPLQECRQNAPIYAFSDALNQALKLEISKGLRHFEWQAADLLPLINWSYIARVMGASHNEIRLKQVQQNAQKIVNAASKIPGCLVTRANFVVKSAQKHLEDIQILNDTNEIVATLFGIRKQTTPHLSLSDFIAPSNGAVGLFALSTSIDGLDAIQIDDISPDEIHILGESLANSLVETANEHMHRLEIAPICAYICPACGYPISPDHSLKREILALTNAQDLGIQLTQSLMMTPLASICGFTIIHPDARYFDPGTISDEQWRDYATRRGLTPEQLASITKCS